MTIREKAHEISDYTIGIREYLHEHPEKSFQEVETTKLIASELEKMGIAYTLTEPTGLYADIQGAKPGRTIALRADMDALEQNEKVDVPFKSQVPGMMHACGHDTHVAMLLGAAKILSGMKDELNGTVRLIFQPAEEIAQGARKMIEQNVLEGVDAIYGQHTMGIMPAGQVSTCDNGMMASCDEFRITIHGKVSHGSAPADGIDATVCAAAMIMDLQTLVSREVSPFDPLVVTVGKVTSGTRFNIISGEAVLEGTVRCESPALHKQVPEIMERVMKNVAAAYRCTAELDYNVLTEVTFNNADMAAIIRNAAAKVVDSPDKYQEQKPVMGSEDFSEYTVLRPAGFAFIGGGGEYSNHSDYFFVDESALEVGVAMHVQVALDYLSE